MIYIYRNAALLMYTYSFRNAARRLCVNRETLTLNSNGRNKSLVIILVCIIYLCLYTVRHSSW